MSVISSSDAVRVGLAASGSESGPAERHGTLDDDAGVDE